MLWLFEDTLHSPTMANCWSVNTDGNASNVSSHVSVELIVLGFNDMPTLVGHFVSSPREREEKDRRDSRGDLREGQGRKKNRNESKETEELKTFPLNPNLLQG